MKTLGAILIFLGTSVSLYFAVMAAAPDPQIDAPSGGLGVGIVILVFGIVLVKRAKRAR